MTVPAASIKEQAETLRVARVCGAVSRAAVVAWADALILADDAPEFALIHVSLSGSARPDPLPILLREVPGTFEPAHVYANVLGSLAARLHEHPEEAARLARLAAAVARQFDLSDDENMATLVFAWELDEWEGWAAEYGGLSQSDDFEPRLRAHLAGYAACARFTFPVVAARERTAP